MIPESPLTDVISWFFLIFGVSLPFIFILKLIGLTGFQEITRYEKHDTFYYRLNPITKIVFTLVVTIVAAATIWWIGGIITLVLLMSYLTLLNGRRKFMLGLYLVLATLIGFAQGYAPYVPSDVVATSFGTYQPINWWTWPSYFAYLGFTPVLTQQQVIYSLQISMRGTSVVLAALLLVLTSTPSEILRSLNKIGLPIAIVFALIVAMRSIPKIFDAIDLSVKSQFMRGLGSNANAIIQPFYYVVAGFASILPVLIHMLRGAKNTAISADTRAFRAFNTRTYLNPAVFTRSDAYMGAIVVAMIGLSTIAIILGFGRSLNYVAFY